MGGAVQPVERSTHEPTQAEMGFVLMNDTLLLQEVEFTQDSYE